MDLVSFPLPSIEYLKYGNECPTMQWSYYGDW